MSPIEINLSAIIALCLLLFGPNDGDVRIDVVVEERVTATMIARPVDGDWKLSMTDASDPTGAVIDHPMGTLSGKGRNFVLKSEGNTKSIDLNKEFPGLPKEPKKETSFSAGDLKVSWSARTLYLFQRGAMVVARPVARVTTEDLLKMIK